MPTQVILGPPGTGKTTKLLSLVEEAIAIGIKPHRIGFVSFTKKAAEEGKTRAVEKFQLSPEEFPHFRTLHSMAFKYLGLRRDQVISWKHMAELGRLLGIDFKGRGQVEDGDVYGMNSADRMLFLEGLARSVCVPLKKVWEDAFEDAIDWYELERFSRGLEAFKRSRMLFDFTDMLERFCSSGVSTMPKFDLLLVDEAQDLSPLQWSAIRLLSQNAANVYISGDDLQGIYRWSGADVQQFINYPGDQITLDQSYRIPLSVHKVAEELSNRITNKRPRFWRPRSEVGSVNYFSSLDEVDISNGTWLLLARNGYMLDELEEWCMSQGVSFNSINRDPLKSPSLAAIRIWENLRRGTDESAEHLIDCFRYLDPGFISPDLMRKFKADDPGRMYGMPELTRLGLKTTAIWHQALVKISPKERDFFIAARKRNEPLLKEPRVKISTIHASKGGQADHVLLLTDMSYRCYSNYQNNPDDEIRVWYVATTRAKQTLNLVMPRTNLGFDI